MEFRTGIWHRISAPDFGAEIRRRISAPDFGAIGDFYAAETTQSITEGTVSYPLEIPPFMTIARCNAHAAHALRRRSPRYNLQALPYTD